MDNAHFVHETCCHAKRNFDSADWQPNLLRSGNAKKNSSQDFAVSAIGRPKCLHSIRLDVRVWSSICLTSDWRLHSRGLEMTCCYGLVLIVYFETKARNSRGWIVETKKVRLSRCSYWVFSWYLLPCHSCLAFSLSQFLAISCTYRSHSWYWQLACFTFRQTLSHLLLHPCPEKMKKSFRFKLHYSIHLRYDQPTCLSASVGSYFDLELGAPYLVWCSTQAAFM